jgi:hypothetical protein
MQARGVVSSAGKTITRTGWRSILTNERYTGQCVLFRPVPGTARKAAEITTRGMWTPLVSEPVYTRVQALLTAPGRVEGRGRPARWMLAGIATCAVCDQPLHSAGRGSADGNVTVYQCRAGHIGRGTEGLDRAISELVVARLSGAAG